MASKIVSSIGGLVKKKKKTGYTPTSTTNLMKSNLSAVEAARPAEYQSTYSPQIEELTQEILKRPKFSYDFNADQIYQQYKDNYTKQANMSMQNTMAQASTLSGGYGNSYASTVGNLAFQNEMANLNNIIPDLYNAAYSRYQNDGAEMRSNLDVLGSLEDRNYNRYQDSLSNWNNERNYAYGQYTDNRNFDYQTYRDNKSDEQWKKNFSYQKKTDNRNFSYQKDRDAVSDAQWEKQFSLSKKKSSSSGKKSDKESYSDALRYCKTYGDDEDAVAEYLSGSGLDTTTKDYLWKVVCGFNTDLKTGKGKSFDVQYEEALKKSKKTGAKNIMSYSDFSKNMPSNKFLQGFSSYRDYLSYKNKNPKKHKNNM